MAASWHQEAAQFNGVEMSNIFEQEESAIEGSDAVNRMRAMAEELISQEKLIKELEDNLASLKYEANSIKTQKLPDLMAECGLSEIAMEDGTRVIVENFLAGTLPKDKDSREKAIEWLEENDAVDLIKTELLLRFEKRQHNEAMNLVEELHERGIDAECKMGVHPQTLLAQIRERMANGEEVPLETLGLFAGRTTKVKPAKAGKEKKGK